jgi:hypothetical protein
MRMHRIVTGLVAFALIGFVPFVSGSAATAAPATVGASHSAVSHQSTAKTALPHRTINAKIDQKGPRKLIFKGKVTGKPVYAKKVVKIERRIGKHGKWKSYAKTHTTKTGGWRHQVGAPRSGRWYFRATTPATNSYAKSHSDVWYTYSF